MEGFLQKKGSGAGVFGTALGGRHNWLKRWFVLEGDVLTYYESFERHKDQGRPVNQKGVIAVSGCKLNMHPHKEREFVFVLEHPERRDVLLQAPSEKLMFMWLTALKKASSGESGHKTMNLDEYYVTLNMDPAQYVDEPPTLKQIQRAYRKACLKCHPDKGGDLAVFDKVSEAFELLSSLKEQEEEDKKHESFQFMAVVTKGPRGEGLGLVVTEDPQKGTIVITKVNDKLLRARLSPEANGHILPRDALVGIGDDNIVGWSLDRVIERLNDFRVPVGSNVRLTFSRRVRIGGDEESFDPVSPPSSPPPPAQRHTPEGSEGTFEPATPTNDAAANEWQAEGDPSQASPFVPVLPSATLPAMEDGPVDAAAPAARSQDGAAAESRHLRKEVSMLKRKLDAAERDVQRLEEENGELNQRVSALQDHVTMADAQRSSLERQLADSAESLRQAENTSYEIQVQFQRVLLNTEAYLQQRKKAAEQHGTLPRDPLDMMQFDRSLLQLRDGEAPAVQEAQRKAVAAAVAVEPSATLLKRWHKQGEGASVKLMRLEQRLAKVGINAEPQPGPRFAGVTDAPPPKLVKRSSARRTSMAPEKMMSAKTSLQQRLEYRPKKEYLVNSSILQNDDGKRWM